MSLLHTKKKAPELPEPTDRLMLASLRWVVEGHVVRQGIDMMVQLRLIISQFDLYNINIILMKQN